MTAPEAGPAADFAARAHVALGDGQLRRNFRRAMDGLMAKRAALFTDADQWRALRAQGTAVRARALARLPDLLERFEARATANGIRVHWAETTDQANAIVLGILRAAQVSRVIKGKSMVSEEMHLNAHLAANGIAAVESDLGEYIIQLAGEAPSHIVMPCIHKNKGEIASLFETHIAGQSYTEDVDALTAAARRVLREQFAVAGAGLSGANFLVAETGSMVLIENEGNGRLSTTLPPLHIAVTGIEKVVERLDDVVPLLALLPRSATGQAITTYVNMISGPRRPGEKDGPTEVHLILLDNGRSRVHADPVLADTLRCIRCGACMNHCPVYTKVGGHAYGSVYPGPIGKILTPQIAGLDQAGDLPHASTLCGACGEICPVHIPIPEILVRLREEAAQVPPAGVTPAVKGAGGRVSRWEGVAWRVWRLVHAHPWAYRLTGRLLGRVGNWGPTGVGPLAAWTRVRTRPRFARTTLHDLAAAQGYDHE